MPSTTTQAPPISDYAIIVDARDNLAVVKRETAPGLEVALPSGRSIRVTEAVPPGHRFATRPIPAGEFVLQYGQPIGTSSGIEEGEYISHANMTDDVRVVRDLPEDLSTPPPDYIPAQKRATFKGFRRADGRVGTRNFVLVVPTSMCASHEAQQISLMAEFLHYSRQRYPNVDGVVAIPHNKGCGCQEGSTIEVMLRTLSNYADHPNVGGVVLIDLGCEKTNLARVEKYLLKREKAFDKPVAKIGIQEVGGTQAAIERGLLEVGRMLPEVNRAVREEVPVSELVMGVKCGGSDGFSGISANPSLGRAADTLVRSGGTVLITEVPEFCGAEHLIAHRAKDAETGRAVFPTGRGTTIGNAIAPVVKLASNSAVFERMSRDIDLSAGGVIEGTETIEEVGGRVFEHVRRVASGEVQARAEEHKHREFQFWAEQTVSL